MKSKSSIFLLIIFLFVACQVEEKQLEGVLTNSQTFYNLEGTHNYPRINFYGRLTNSTNSAINLKFEDRAYNSSQLDQFIWVLEKDTLNLLCYSLNEVSDQEVKIEPDSVVQIGLRTDLLDFWDEEKNELSDSTYYKNLLKSYSEKGKIYFINNDGELILMKRKSPFRIIEGYKKPPAG